MQTDFHVKRVMQARENKDNSTKWRERKNEKKEELKTEKNTHTH